jgi:hypothetical protein
VRKEKSLLVILLISFLLSFSSKQTEYLLAGKFLSFQEVNLLVQLHAVVFRRIASHEKGLGHRSGADIKIKILTFIVLANNCSHFLVLNIE